MSQEFANPWYDARNKLSPRVFKVPDEPCGSEDVLDFYKVLTDGQSPSVLAVVNAERSGRRVGNLDEVVGQYVTVAGAKRALSKVLKQGRTK